MKDQIVHSFPYQKDNAVNFRLRHYKEKCYVDIRLYFKPKDVSEMLPTRKGITMPVEFLGELKKGITMCEREVASGIA